MKKTLVLPPWMNTIKFYNTDVHDFYVSSGVLEEGSYADDCVVGVSLGCSAILERVAYVKGNIVLINPLVPRKSLFLRAMRWSSYILGGLFVERQKFTRNPFKWVWVLRRAYVLLTTDFSDALDMVPKDRLVVIRNKEDIFFCDTESILYLRAQGVHVVEVEGGHNWNVYTEDEMNQQIAYIQSKN